MELQVLVLDYDGTVATDSILDPTVRAAIADVRARGVLVIIATGRTLHELEHVAGDLRFIGGVVAENGAVLAFPREERVLPCGHEPPGC